MTIVVDDRLLIEHLLHGVPEATTADVATTSYWYYRACRAAVAGAGGRLSGPFTALGGDRQAAAIRRLLELPDDVALPSPRRTVPLMAAVAERHPQLNVLNLEAIAAAIDLTATVWLSSRGAMGVLPAILDAEGVGWRIVEIP